MKQKTMAIFVALIIGGCSSNSGVSTSSSGASTTPDGQLITASVSSDTYSVDTTSNNCYELVTDEDTGEISYEVTGTEPGLTSVAGTFTVTRENITDSTGGLFPGGIVLNAYVVSYNPVDQGPPALPDVVFNQTQALTGDTLTADIPVILADLDQTINTHGSNSGSSANSYRVHVNYKGEDISGNLFSIEASTVLEFGNFDNC